MRSRFTLLVLVLAVSLVTPAGAYHLSVGGEATVGVSSEESVDAPSVPPGEGEPDPDGTLYERGLVRDCHETNASLEHEPERTDHAARADPFCGRLVYHEDTNHSRESPPDQDVRLEGWSFDVVATTKAEARWSYCQPWCAPGGEQGYGLVHALGHEAGLTERGEEAREGDRGRQTYGAHVQAPNAVQRVTGDADAWKGNGWLAPTGARSFVGFLVDDDGTPVDDEQLAAVASEEGLLPEGATPQVCGFSTSVQFVRLPPTLCDIVFTWQDASSSEDSSGADRDPCASPAYVCESRQPAWYGHLTCYCLPGGPLDSTTDYEVWHFVVAPAASECLAEPLFRFASDDATHPYLAHDLDAFVTPGSGVDERARGGQALIDHGPATVREARETADESVVRPLIEQTLAVPPPASDTLGPLLAAREEPGQLLVKEHRVEPNAPGDTSQSRLEGPALERTEVEECWEVRGWHEAPWSLDPWVDVVDNRLERTARADGVDDPLAAFAARQVPPGEHEAADAYLDGRDGQDASNRPGPGFYTTQGKLGVFADKDDDRRYDQRGSQQKLHRWSAGAYPMVWDVELDREALAEGASPAEAMAEGCQADRFQDQGWTEAAERAGYGPRTGLIQVAYLQEPTVLVDRPRDEAYAFAGDRAFVFLSDALADLHATDAAPGFVETRVQALIGDHVPATPAEVVYTHELAGTDGGAFLDQCPEPTGGFTNAWSFTHGCGPDPAACPGDTIVTAYLWENRAEEGRLGAGSDLLPALEPLEAEEPYRFPAGNNTWIDVDPLDGDAQRNSQRSSAPPAR